MVEETEKKVFGELAEQGLFELFLSKVIIRAEEPTLNRDVFVANPQARDSTSASRLLYDRLTQFFSEETLVLFHELGVGFLPRSLEGVYNGSLFPVDQDVSLLVFWPQGKHPLSVPRNIEAWNAHYEKIFGCPFEVEDEYFWTGYSGASMHYERLRHGLVVNNKRYAFRYEYD